MRALTAVALVSVVSLVACGDDGVHHFTDAAGPPIDTALPDAPPDAPAVGPVTVTVSFRDAPAPGFTVYFLDASSHQVAEVVTGDDGVATAAMAAGGSITVVDPTEDLTGTLDHFAGQLYTIMGVAPGDDLAIDSFPAHAVVPTLTFDVTVPVLTGATSYQLATSCGAAGVTPGSASTVTLQGCNGTADILVVALDSDGITPLGSIFTPDVAVADGQPLTITDAYTAGVASTATVTNVSAAVNGGSITKQLITARGPVFSTIKAAAFDAGALTATLPFVADASRAAFTQVMTTQFAQTTLTGQMVTQWGPATDTYSLDGSTVEIADFDAPPLVDLPAQTVTYTPDPGGRPTDGVVTTLQVTSTATSTWRWFVVAPSDQTGVTTLPALPTDEFDFRLADATDASVLAFETTSVTGGYRALAALHPWVDFDVALRPLVVAGTTGTAVVAVPASCLR